ncbi:MAG: sigma 54-interacting transcriptional regulator [Sandaracinus sp.]
MRDHDAEDPAPSEATVSLPDDEEAPLAIHVTLVGAASEATHDLGAGPATIGTHAGATLRLDDDAVSRFHVEIAIERGRVRVRDLGSRNGTRLDGVVVRDADAASGSVLSIGRTRLRIDVHTASKPAALSASERFGALRGRSKAMRRVFAVLERAARNDATVLLGGETGTGKEAAAESIHAASARREAPFLVVDCGALAPTLLDAELFGHEKGAFTGAVGARAGVFEAAQGGTVFLDEVGELGLDLQPKLLRVLERREVRRVGTSSYVPVDVRIVAATHRDLRAEVNARRFRADLYYRLAVLEVRMPALRERPEDLPLLVDHFLESMQPTDEAALALIRSPRFVAGLAEHAWPGNVRELRNYVERALALEGIEPTGGEKASEAPAVRADLTLKSARELWSAPLERAYLESVLARSGGNVSAAARVAGVDRVHFYRLLWRHGLR